VNLPEATEQLLTLSRQLHGALDWLRDSAEDSADKERQYRKARALAWVNNTEGTAGFREAQVDSDTADLRYERDLAEKLEKAAVEKIRGVRQEIGAWQTLLAAHRAEAEFARTGPQEGP
jgi:hypothetical protein